MSPPPGRSMKLINIGNFMNGKYLGQGTCSLPLFLLLFSYRYGRTLLIKLGEHRAPRVFCVLVLISNPIMRVHIPVQFLQNDKVCMYVRTLHKRAKEIPPSVSMFGNHHVPPRSLILFPTFTPLQWSLQTE